MRDKMVWHALNYGKGEQNIHVETNLDDMVANNENDDLKQKIADSVIKNAPQDAGVHNVRMAWFSYTNYELDKERMTASVNFDADRDLTDMEYEKMAHAVFDVTEEIIHTPWKAMVTNYVVYAQTDLEIDAEFDESQKEVLQQNIFTDSAVNIVYGLPGDYELLNARAEYTESHNRDGNMVTGLRMILNTNRELDYDEKQFIADEIKAAADHVLEEDFSAAVDSIGADPSLEK